MQLKTLGGIITVLCIHSLQAYGIRYQEIRAYTIQLQNKLKLSLQGKTFNPIKVNQDYYSKQELKVINILNDLFKNLSTKNFVMHTLGNDTVILYLGIYCEFLIKKFNKVEEEDFVGLLKSYLTNENNTQQRDMLNDVAQYLADKGNLGEQIANEISLTKLNEMKNAAVPESLLSYFLTQYLKKYESSRKQQEMVLNLTEISRCLTIVDQAITQAQSTK